MPRTDLWRISATRVEVDQRSREARLQLERAQQSLVPPTQSWLRRMYYRFGSRLSDGAAAEGRSAGSQDGEARDIPTGFGLVASGLPAAVLVTLAGAAA